MKKFLLIAMACMTFAACDEENSDLRDELKNQGNRLEMLESEVESLKVKIEGLNQTYKAVTEMLGGGLITAVEGVTGEGGKSGYKLTIQTPEEEGDGFKIEDYTIWNGESVAGPSLGVEKDGDNGYYWTLDNEPLKDADGNKVYTSGIAPKLRINEGRFEISYDGGDSWHDLGVFSGTVTAGSDIRVEKNGNVVVIKQEGKADIEIPITPTNTLGITFTNIDADAGMRVLKNGVYLVEYELKNASENAIVKAEGLDGDKNIYVEHIPAEKRFKITVKDEVKSEVVLVHVYDGTVCMHRSFNITPNSAIKAITISKPELNFPLADISGNFEYTGELTLAEAATENITLSVVPVGAPAGAFTTEEVTINQGSTTATYKVVVKRSALSAETSYMVPLVFSTQNSNYHVVGETDMTVMRTAIPQKIALGEANYNSPYTRAGTEGANNPAGYVPLYDGKANTYWTSDYNNPPAGDPTYGVYIDIEWSQKAYCMQIVWAARGTGLNGNPTECKIGIYSNNLWQMMEHITENLSVDNAQPNETSIYKLSDGTLFNQVRFGIPRSNMGDLITDAKKSAAISALDVYVLY